MYCKNCGKEISDDAVFCSHCGGKVQELSRPEVDPSALRCPVCGSTDVESQVHQEDRGSKTKSKTKSVYRQKGHGCLWWLIIGWWWWMVDIFLWIFIFPLRLLFQLFKKKKYVGKSTTDSTTKNKITYTTVHMCKHCGHNWK